MSGFKFSIGRSTNNIQMSNGGSTSVQVQIAFSYVGIIFVLLLSSFVVYCIAR